MVHMRIAGRVDDWKLQAAERALGYVEDGMLVGLGTGSTAARFVDMLAQQVKEGLSITCVPTSEATRAPGRASRHRRSPRSTTCRSST